jgi:hypothetical protein
MLAITYVSHSTATHITNGLLKRSYFCIIFDEAGVLVLHPGYGCCLVSNDMNRLVGNNSRRNHAQIKTLKFMDHPVEGFATGWTVRESNTGGSEIFRTRLNRTWGTPSLLYKGYRFFPRGVKRPQHGVDHPPHLAPRLRKE